MNKMIFARVGLAPVVVAGLVLLQLAGAGSALAAANCIKGEHKAALQDRLGQHLFDPDVDEGDDRHDRGYGKRAEKAGSGR
jgi:hypothetical protein